MVSSGSVGKVKVDSSSDASEWVPQVLNYELAVSYKSGKKCEHLAYEPSSMWSEIMMVIKKYYMDLILWDHINSINKKTYRVVV